jgi:proline iminopeptidase
MKRKGIVITAALLAAILLAAAGGFWYLSGQPLYRPGMVRDGEGLSAPLDPPAQREGSPTWLVEPGIDLAHFAVGQGRNVLVIHGGPGEPFREPMTGLAPLAGEYRFHYYDQRGCGGSTRPIDRFGSANVYENMLALDRSLGLGAQIADIERIRRILGEQQLILIGHSWGGFLAAMYAAEFPERVEALILVSPANTLVMPQPDAGSDLFASVRAGLPADQQPAFDAFMQEYMDFNALFGKSEAELVRMNEQFGRYYMQVSDIPAQDQVLEPGIAGGWMVWAQYVSMGRRHDYRDALRDVDVPVLVIHGADDLQSEAASRLYADAFPRVEFVVIEAAGHFSFEDQPQEFARIVGAFLEGR